MLRWTCCFRSFSSCRPASSSEEARSSCAAARRGGEAPPQRRRPGKRARGKGSSARQTGGSSSRGRSLRGLPQSRGKRYRQGNSAGDFSPDLALLRVGRRKGKDIGRAFGAVLVPGFSATGADCRPRVEIPFAYCAITLFQVLVKVAPDAAAFAENGLQVMPIFIAFDALKSGGVQAAVITPPSIRKGRKVGLLLPCLLTTRRRVKYPYLLQASRQNGRARLCIGFF